MSAYLSKLLGFVIFSVFILVQYYHVGIHNETGTGYTAYAITLAIAYAIYKFRSLTKDKHKVTFSPLSIIKFASIHLFILCFIYFNLTGGSSGLAPWVLFGKIELFLLLPITLTLIVYSLGKKTIHLLVPSFEQEESSFRFLLSLGFGFVLFLTLLATIGAFGQYNIVAVIAILLVAIGVSYREIIQSCTHLWTHKIEFPNHKPNGTFFEQVNLPLLSTELLFMILTFLISVNFINIVRPMPIGWDDLGVYMNLPQIMANNGTLIKGAGMIAWQTLTGIGFMFHSAPQAFFMNQLGGILSIIVLMTAIGSLLGNKPSSEKSKSFVNLPLLAATMFYAMPMVIFQQAKDMKLDPGLFFVSVIGIYGMISLFLRYRDTLEVSNESKTDANPLAFFAHHKNLAYIFIIGTIVGLAFAIKFTTLMLILGLLGVIFYAKLGLAGFVGYFALFVGVFTKGNLWAQLNVNYPKDDVHFLSIVTISSLVIAAIFFGVAFYQKKAEAFRKTFLISALFLLGVGVSVSPWLAKNISETGLQNLSISNILNGKGDVFVPDYTKIYGAAELDARQKGSMVESTSSSGKTTNEDLGRYFGYEDGVNNYLKLPLNLTMQSNQPGEYTEITPFFLALIPVIFLFLTFKNPFWITGLVAMLVFEYAYFFLSSNPGVYKYYPIGLGISVIAGIIFYIFQPKYRKKIVTGFSIWFIVLILRFSLLGLGANPSQEIAAFFAAQSLPGGYAYIALFAFLPLGYFSFALDKKDKKTDLFLYNLVFASFYVFLFVIAAYGIVWYGISMYFAFLLAIMIAGSYMTEYRSEEKESNGNIVRFFGAIVLLCVTGVYFFASSIPHGWANLKSAGFNEFKSGTFTQEEGIFSSHADYFTILSALNITSSKDVFTSTLAKVQNPLLTKLLTNNLGGAQDLGKLQQILSDITRTDLTKLGLSQMDGIAIQTEARSILANLYETVLYPSKEQKNTGGIYRIGTFLTYFIDNNRSRYYDDSLVTDFGKYFYDTDPDVTINRMKELGLKYLLVDLNAATIDKDPRHDLTKRFEQLLSTFKSDKLELIQTDSLCLQIALEEKNPATYMTYAGVNYESYKKDEKGNETTINRGEKQFQCYNHILGLMKGGNITEKSYSYLIPLAKYFDKNPPKNQEEMLKIFESYVNHGWLALFRIK